MSWTYVCAFARLMVLMPLCHMMVMFRHFRAYTYDHISHILDFWLYSPCSFLLLFLFCKHPFPFSLDNASCELQDRTSPLASSVCTISCSGNPFSYVPNPQICMGPTCYPQRAASLGNAHVGEDSPTIYLNLIFSGTRFRTIDVRLSLICKGSWVVFAARGQFLWAYGQGSTFSCIHTYLHFSRLGRFT